MSSRDRRARATGRLGVTQGERYALMPREVLVSDAYAALPDWAVRVLIALAAQYYRKDRNGSLALPVGDARTLGVRRPWQIYAGLRLLEQVELATCTRRGHLAHGGKVASLYALTWRGINKPPEGVTYDEGVKVCATPGNGWARWTRSDNWDTVVRTFVNRARGTGSRTRSRDRGQQLRPRKNPDTHPVGKDRTPPGGTEQDQVVPTRGVRKPRNVVPPPGVASKTPGLGAERGAIERTRARPAPPSSDSSGQRTSDAALVRKWAAACPQMTEFELANVLKLDLADIRRHLDVAP